MADDRPDQAALPSNQDNQAVDSSWLGTNQATNQSIDAAQTPAPVVDIVQPSASPSIPAVENIPNGIPVQSTSAPEQTNAELSPNLANNAMSLTEQPSLNTAPALAGKVIPVNVTKSIQPAPNSEMQVPTEVPQPVVEVPAEIQAVVNNSVVSNTETLAAPTPVQPEPATAPEMQAQATVPNPLPAANMPKPMRNNVDWIRWLVIAVGGIVAIALIAWGMWWLGIGFGAPLNSQSALTKMATSINSAKSYRVDGTLTLNVSITPTAQASATTTISPSPSVSASPMVSASLSQTTDLTSSSSTTTISSANPTSSSLDSTNTSTSSTTVTTQSITSASKIPIQFHNDKSDQINKGDVSADLSAIQADISSAIPTVLNGQFAFSNGNFYLNAPLLATLANVSSDQWVSLSTQTSLHQLLPIPGVDVLKQIDGSSLANVVNKMTTKGQRLGYENIGPVSTAHYRYELDPSKLGSDDVNWKTLLSKPAVMELWLGVWDGLPYKIVLNSASSSSVNYLDSMTIQLTNFNQAISLEVPKSVVGYEQVAGQLSNSPEKLQQESRDIQRKADLQTLKTALDLYYGDNKKYPDTKNIVVKTNATNNPLQILITNGYLKKIPVDPVDSKYWYGYKSDGLTYQLNSIAENAATPGSVKQGDLYLLFVTNSTQATGGSTQSSTSGTTSSTNTQTQTSSSSTNQSGRLPTGQ